MNYRDILITCEECGKQFVFTVEKQRQMAERGLEVVAPDRCARCTQQAQYGGKLHGHVKWFSLEKGYGFIVQEDGSEIFVHRSGVPATAGGSLPPLEEGQEVLYKVTDSPRGAQAVEVAPYSAQEG
jgi:CspA family cold shock protein